MSDAALQPLTPSAPVLKTTLFERIDWWMKGPGRWSGRLLVLAPIPIAIVFFIVYAIVQNVFCGPETGPCRGVLRIGAGTVILALWGVACLCLATLALRVERGMRRARRRTRLQRRHRTFLEELSSLSEADRAAHEQFLHRLGQGPTDEGRARDATTLARNQGLLLAATGLIMLLTLGNTVAAADGIHFEASEPAILALGHFLAVVGFVPVLWLNGRIFLTLRRATRELWDDQEIAIERLEADLRRRTRGETAPVLAPAFRSFVPRGVADPSSQPQKH